MPNYIEIAKRGLRTSGDLLEYLVALSAAITSDEVSLRKAEVLIKAADKKVKLLDIHLRSGQNMPLYAKARRAKEDELTKAKARRTKINQRIRDLEAEVGGPDGPAPADRD